LTIQAEEYLAQYDFIFKNSSDAFLGCAQAIAHIYSDKIEKMTGYPVTLSTSGGTSDARFIKDLCPVIELGLMNATAHHIDEHARVSDLILLQKIYEDLF
jgi:succinyl-diaminopimelate desuccinylase